MSTLVLRIPVRDDDIKLPFASSPLFPFAAWMPALPRGSRKDGNGALRACECANGVAFNVDKLTCGGESFVELIVVKHTLNAYQAGGNPRQSQVTAPR